jgi:hypothetical protein
VLLFDTPPHDREETLARLRALVSSFAGVTADGDGAGRRVGSNEPHAMLDDVLGSLAARAGAIHAVVVDSGSPVLWGSSHETPLVDVEQRGLRRRAALLELAAKHGLDALGWLDRGPADNHARGDWPGAESVVGLATELGRLHARYAPTDLDGWRRVVLTTRAVAAARQQMPKAASVATGLRASLQSPEIGYVVWAIGGIYLLVLAFEGTFSDLRAHKAVVQSLGRIEQLVERLPPIDPRPSARVVRLRR